ncbi:MAG: crossover junction endodeoxyribonuclease RuvC [Firmicutes bacterium]|nr:crossover junction endodeoxyribonuclease RuvC [Bacillota bacterium]
MIVLGLDPGLATTGYGLIKEEKGKIELVDYGCIKTKAEDSHVARLLSLYEGFEALLQEGKPDAVALEKLFFNQNTKTALQVGEARGVIMLGIAKKKKPLFEYTPLQVKQAVTGYGRASKQQIQRMVKNILNLPRVPTPDDAADALAVAICQCHFHNFETTLETALERDTLIR